MKKNELVWRELIDAAMMRKQRRWNNVDDLAFRAGVAPSTAAYALNRPIEIGAVAQHHAGFTLVNPGKLLTLACAARSITNDSRAVVTLSEEDLHRLLAAPFHDRMILGGASAAIDLLGGTNTVSDYSDHLIYLRDSEVETTVHEALQSMATTTCLDPDSRDGRLILLRADPRAARTWRKYTSFAQTYVDLFATPGWQASEFRLALRQHFFSSPDWDQE